MRFCTSLLAIIALVLATPINCAHAFAWGTADVPMVQPHETPDDAHAHHHGHGHHDTRDGHHLQTDDHRDHAPCPDDCDGVGPDCSGCFTITAIFKPLSVLSNRTPASMDGLIDLSNLLGIDTSFDPPPPRS